MSNDLISINKELAPLRGKGSALINALIARSGPMTHEAALCEEDLKRCKQIIRKHEFKLKHSEILKLWRELLIPRTQAVITAYRDLRDLCFSHEAITAELAVKMLSAFYVTMGKAKTLDKDLATLLTQTAALFDPAVDAVGVDLKMWEAVPRHPVVVAMALHSLIVTKVFAGPSEVADECRKTHKKLKVRLRDMLDWVRRLVEADLHLFQEDRDEWRKAYQDLDSIKTAEALIELWEYSANLDEREQDQLIVLAGVLGRMQTKIENPELYEMMYEDIEPAYSDVLYEDDGEDDAPPPPPKLEPPIMPWKMKKQYLKEVMEARRANEESTGEDHD